MSDLQPRNDFVLIAEKKADPYHVHKGYQHIIVPDKFEHGPEDRPVVGTIIAKGETCMNDRIGVGMVALAGKWSGARFFREETSYVLLRETDILAILHE